MKKAILILALLAGSALAKEPTVNYVGQGRYTCSGNAAVCAQIDANNRAESARQQYQYDRERDRANRYIEDSRRREEERRLRTYGQ